MCKTVNCYIAGVGRGGGGEERKQVLCHTVNVARSYAAGNS